MDFPLASSHTPPSFTACSRGEKTRLSAALHAIAQVRPEKAACAGGKRKGETAARCLHPHFIPRPCLSDNPSHSDGWQEWHSGGNDRLKTNLQVNLDLAVPFEKASVGK